MNEIMADLYSEGRQADQETAEEIISRLEKKNYIPSSYLTRKEYAYLLLKEYSEYVKGKSKKELDNEEEKNCTLPA
ncbi:MAG: hypothetical protein WA133_12115 [Syntrophales bacterium]